jgi:hypothetical protein
MPWEENDPPEADTGLFRGLTLRLVCSSLRSYPKRSEQVLQRVARFVIATSIATNVFAGSKDWFDSFATNCLNNFEQHTDSLMSTKLDGNGSVALKRINMPEQKVIFGLITTEYQT